MSQKLYIGTTNEENIIVVQIHPTKKLNKNPDNYINNKALRLADGFIPSQRKVFYGSLEFYEKKN